MPFKSKEQSRLYRQKYDKEQTRKKANPSSYLFKRDSLSKEEYEKWKKEKNIIKGRESSRISQKSTRERNNKLILEFKINHPCAICGNNDIRCLDIHHSNPSQKNFSIYRKGKRTSIKNLNKELSQCDVLCKNCHMRHHNEDNDEYIIKKMEEIRCKLLLKVSRKERIKLNSRLSGYKNKLYIRDYKRACGCKICGELDFRCLVFHHTGDEKKTRNISRLNRYSIKKIKEEINKCIILCHNCHSIHHFLEK